MSDISSSRVLFSDSFDFWKFVGVENEKLKTHAIKSKSKSKNQTKINSGKDKENSILAIITCDKLLNVSEFGVKKKEAEIKIV